MPHPPNRVPFHQTNVYAGRQNLCLCKKHLHQAVELRLGELQPLLTIEKLDREMVDLLIDKVLVHGERDIEIVWLGSGIF
jgi:hypothetical protein